jgi:hypothetical protein
MGFIYKLTFPSEKSYIGQTIRDIHKRLEEHQLPSSKCVAVSHAIQKYGWENVKKEWYEVLDEDLNFYEEMLVALLGTLAPNGYNLMEGGGSKGRPSEESKQKMSEANFGEKNHMFGKEHTEESKQKISDALSGEKHPMYGKTGEKTSMFGKKHTEETKQKMREALYGEKNHMFGKEHTEETKQKISESMTGEKNHASKKVYQYTLDGTYVNEFYSSGEAARTLGKINGSSIRKCARGDCKDAYGFKWSYIEL